MPRTIWKGSISFGLVHVPVGLYPAEKKNDLSFSLLDRRDLSPVGYKRYNKKTGEEVPSEEMVKGYELEEGKYVVLEPEDFQAANPEASKTVQILEFVDADSIDPVFFEKPYYLAPLQTGRKGYALLRETLRRTGKVGIAKVVIRTKEYLAALVAEGPVMVLNLLRFGEEIRDTSNLSIPGDDLSEVDVAPNEVEMAERLVEGMLAEWDPEKFHDDYREDLLAMIRKKAETGETKAVAPVEPEEEAPAAVDIMSLLKRSVEERGEEGAAEKKRKAA